MIGLWLMAAAAAQDGLCEPIGLGDVLNVQAPAVIVLGERHGTEPDLSRATRVVRALLATGEPVTVALEAVHQKYQPVLDDYAAGKVDPLELETKLEWKDAWGFPFAPYSKLVMSSGEGAKVVAAGLDLGPAPADAPKYPIPPGYSEILESAMGGHQVPPGAEPSFIASMAWRDYAIGDLATKSWDGQGFLVVVTGRGHVEGGKGVGWQLDQRLDVPVTSYVLAWGKQPPCFEGDLVWRLGLFG